MFHPETSEERKKRFKEMSSLERQSLLKRKMKAQGLEEGSGVYPLSFYDSEEICDLIEIMSRFPEMKTNHRRV